MSANQKEILSVQEMMEMLRNAMYTGDPMLQPEGDRKTFREIIEEELRKQEMTERVQQGKCPECGGELIHEGGCSHCLECGWAACSND